MAKLFADFMECSSILLQKEKINRTEAITGFLKKNSFSIQNADPKN